jgi:hypothetical protein
VYGFGRQAPEVGGKEPAYRYYERAKGPPPAKETALTAMDVELAALRAMHRESRLVLCMGRAITPGGCQIGYMDLHSRGLSDFTWTIPAVIN